MAEQRVVVVTGGGTGIGKAIAARFAAEGARLVLAGRTESRLVTVAESIAAGGGVAHAVPTDVRDEGQVRRLFESAVAEFGRVDVLVAGAATPVVKPTVDLTLEEWNTTVETNLTGTFLCAREAGRRMLAQGGGRIVTMGAVNAFSAFPERAAHAASKAGVVQLSRALAVEWAARGITVNCVIPGWTHTEIVQDYVDSGAITTDRIIARTPMGRMATPGEIAEAVYFLTGPGAGFVTGHALVVDGGWTAYGFYEDAFKSPNHQF